MSYQDPVKPDWRRPWQQQLATQRHIEKTMLSGGVDIEDNNLTAEQRRRFQRIEFVKMIALIIGMIILIAGGLFVFGLLTHQ